MVTGTFPLPCGRAKRVESYAPKTQASYTNFKLGSFGERTVSLFLLQTVAGRDTKRVSTRLTIEVPYKSDQRTRVLV